MSSEHKVHDQYYPGDYHRIFLHPAPFMGAREFDPREVFFMGISRSVELSTDSKTITESNPRRKTLTILNEDLVIAIHIALGDFPASNSTYRIAAGSGLEWNQTNPYYGPVQAISESGTPRLSIMEW